MIRSEFRVKNIKMDKPCFVSTFEINDGGSGGVSVMIWGIFTSHTLGYMTPINDRLCTAYYLCIVVHHVPQFVYGVPFL